MDAGAFESDCYYSRPSASGVEQAEANGTVPAAVWEVRKLE